MIPANDRRAPPAPLAALLRGIDLCCAVGAAVAAICALALRDGVLPPTINYTTPDPDCDLDYVPNTARAHQVEHALSNNLGFGGHNASLVFKRFTG